MTGRQHYAYLAACVAIVVLTVVVFCFLIPPLVWPEVS